MAVRPVQIQVILGQLPVSLIRGRGRPHERVVFRGAPGALRRFGPALVRGARRVNGGPAGGQRRLEGGPPRCPLT